MKTYEIGRVVAQIKYQPIYSCDRCLIKGAGTTAHIEVDSYGIEVLKEALHNQPMQSVNMPVGWSCSYSTKKDIFTCPECLTKGGWE